MTQQEATNYIKEQVYAYAKEPTFETDSEMHYLTVNIDGQVYRWATRPNFNMIRGEWQSGKDKTLVGEVSFTGIPLTINCRNVMFDVGTIMTAF